MSESVKGNINAQGIPGREVSDREPGNQSKGVLDQTRPTGVMATGEKSRKIGLEREGKERGSSKR